MSTLLIEMIKLVNQSYGGVTIWSFVGESGEHQFGIDVLAFEGVVGLIGFSSDVGVVFVSELGLVFALLEKVSLLGVEGVNWNWGFLVADHYIFHPNVLTLLQLFLVYVPYTIRFEFIRFQRLEFPIALSRKTIVTYRQEVIFLYWFQKIVNLLVLFSQMRSTAQFVVWFSLVPPHCLNWSQFVLVIFIVSFKTGDDGPNVLISIEAATDLLFFIFFHVEVLPSEVLDIQTHAVVSSNVFDKFLGLTLFSGCLKFQILLMDSGIGSFSPFERGVEILPDGFGAIGRQMICYLAGERVDEFKNSEND